jgi:hypothetical protein
VKLLTKFEIMRNFYVTKKQVNKFIENSLKKFDSLESFRNELDKVISELSLEEKAQLKFYNRVKKELNYENQKL